ncbi:MAG: hypothetical protein R3D67_22020 [Hyphomicrobiaceae bacterium]
MWNVVIEGWTYLINVTGLPIEPGPAALITVCLFVIVKAFLALSKSRREFKRISAELKKATETISDHMRTEFDGQVEKLNKLQANVQRTLNRRMQGVHDRFEALQDLLRPTEAVTSVIADSEINGDSVDATSGAGDADGRLQVAESVQLSRGEVAAGVLVSPSNQDANVYEFAGYSGPATIIGSYCIHPTAPRWRMMGDFPSL